ncbi:MAG: diadenylate cyclase [Desulfobacterales bacterium]|nr:MAG: diadenylate cyclase [Desulfobacterales bacterium]
MDRIISFFYSFRWQDILDITVTSYILFRFYILFRGTNVFRILIGMTILWFFQRFAVSLGLVVTSWVVQGVAAVAALIIIVVFRNEIRSVLQARNLKSLLWGFSYKTVNTTIEFIVDSVFNMAQRKCGALIVFPGKEDLEEEIQRGIPWKGVISNEMISSIFWPDNPVHDGAAIIRGNQIIEVCAILPLSHRSDLPSHYGTRHRAALGLAESTDAMVIVVSEERGDVLVAKDSHLREVKQKRGLEKKLQEHMGLVPKKKPFVRKESFETVMAALLSIIFITGVWYNVTSGRDTLVTLRIPIEYKNRKPAMEILQRSANAVSLDLSGSGALIKSIKPDQIQVSLDLNKAVVGNNSYTVTRENISLPPGILLKSVYPTEINVELDVTIKKKLPVQVDWVGKLPDHLILVEAQIDPQTVEIIGGKRILEKISTLYTEKVPLDNLKGKGNITANLALNPASLKIAPGSKEKITIKYETEERYPESSKEAAGKGSE